MDIFPVVCGLLSFLLIGPSDAIVVTLKLGSATRGERINFNATCKGHCKGVMANVTALSGFPRLYGRNGSLPHPGDCKDCFCSDDKVCGKISFNCSSSVAFSVVPVTDFRNATLTVEADNLDMVTKITLPSKQRMLGSVKRGNRKNFKVTCYGPCEQLSAVVRGTSGAGRPFLHGAEKSLPHLDVDSRCKDCFCESIARWWLNICQYLNLKDSSSLYLSVTTETKYENGFLMVEAINFKSIEEIVSTPPQLLHLSSSRVGFRSNFYITCHGPCRQVHVKAVSGKPELLLAKKFMPFMQGSKCQNCLRKIDDDTFKDSSSFYLTVPTTELGDVVQAEAANLKGITEIPHPSKTLDIGDMEDSERRIVKLTCNGPCKELRVDVTLGSGNRGTPIWYVSEQTFDDNPSVHERCQKCICDKSGFLKNTCDFRSLDDASKLFFLFRPYPGYPIKGAKVFFEGSNLKAEEIVIS